MTIKRMLNGRNFTPESAAILVKAFHSVVADLDLQTAVDRDRAAKIVIGLAAGQTILDAENLRGEAARLDAERASIAGQVRQSDAIRPDCSY
jgi:hypothetical protein